MNLTFEECMDLPPVENPLSECFECNAGMCRDVCKGEQYEYEDGGYGHNEKYINKFRYKILEEILEEEQTNDFLNNIQ